MSKNLPDVVTDAIKALEAIYTAASDTNRLRLNAETAAAAAKAEADEARAKMREALDKLSEREAMIVKANADAAGAIATLEAEKKILAQRDREARDELDRLRLSSKPA